MQCTRTFGYDLSARYRCIALSAPLASPTRIWKPFSVIVSRPLPTSAGSREVCREPATKTVGMGTVGKPMIGRIARRLCGPGGPVVLFRERRLAKLREELVEAL